MTYPELQLYLWTLNPTHTHTHAAAMFPFLPLICLCVIPVRCWCKVVKSATSSFLSANFCISFHLSAVKTFARPNIGGGGGGSSWFRKRAAWHWAFPADIGEDCSSWSPQCWNPRESCLFLQQWTDKSRAHLTACRTHFEELHRISRVLEQVLHSQV